MQKAKLVVPYDAYPGKRIQIRLNNQDYMVQIPANARPGQEILIQVPITFAPQPQARASYGYSAYQQPPTYNQSYYLPAAAPPPPPQQYYPPAAAAASQQYSVPMANYAQPPPPPAIVPPPAAAAQRVPPPPPVSMAEYGKQTYMEAIAPKLKLVVTADHVITPENASTYAEFNILSVYRGEVVSLVEGDLTNGLPAPYQDYLEIETNDGRKGKVAKAVLVQT